MKMMMKHTCLFMIVLCTLLAGCLDLNETVQMNSDGNGTLTIQVDLSKIKYHPELYTSEEDDYSEPDPADYDPEDSLMLKNNRAEARKEWAEGIDQDIADMEETMNELRQGPIAQNVNFITVNKEKATITLVLTFKNVTELNELYHALDSALITEKANPDHSQIFLLKGKTLNRNANFFYLNLPYVKDSTLSADAREEVGDNPRAISDLDYSLACIFDKPIASCSNKNYVLSADKKSCTLKAKVFDLIENKRTLTTDIIFK